MIDPFTFPSSVSLVLMCRASGGTANVGLCMITGYDNQLLIVKIVKNNLGSFSESALS